MIDARELRKEYGDFVAVEGSTFSVEQGEVFGIIGPNGAGKTTFFNCVTGALNPTAGKVHFKGEDLTDQKPYEVARQGLVRTFQLTRELSTMTTLENVQVAAPDHPGERTLPALLETDGVHEYEREITEQAHEYLSRFELEQKAPVYASQLSGGERKMLGLARGLMLEPDMLMLDEPFAGIDEGTVKEITPYIQALNDDGMTIVIVEHGLEELVEIVDRLIVLNQGTVLADGPTEEVMNNQQVIDVYLGNPIDV